MPLNGATGVAAQGAAVQAVHALGGANPGASFVAHCESLLQTLFKVPHLRGVQRTVLEALDRTPGVLATLPTGSGKTFLYVLPALVFQAIQPASGPVLVVCPLIALMRDQVRRMREANIPSVLFTSDQTEDERRAAYAQLFSGQTRLIFASPERMVLPSFLNALGRVNISMAVVDEAHCVVSWGHGFRPEYGEIGKFLSKLRPPRILALTATASRESRKLIRQAVFPAGFPVEEIAFSPLGKNVFVDVERVYSEDEKWLSLVAALKQSHSQKAIVYFTRREACEQAALRLRKQKIHAVAYHAGLRKDERQSVETYLHASQTPVVVCATLAFGMGVDLSGVSLVVVVGFPGNVEEYFQMIGRAGRGGEAARSLLIWSGSDPKRRYFQFGETFPEVSDLRVRLERMGAFFPGMQGRAFVTLADLERVCGAGEKSAEKAAASCVSALRSLGALESPLFNESYVSVNLAAHMCVADVLASLPAGVTRRSRFFEALCHLHPPEWRHVKGTRALVPLSVLSDDAMQVWERCAEILDFYSGQKILRFEVRPASVMKEGFLLKGSLQDALKDLPRYALLRRHFLESLSQLDKLAQSQHCRLAQSEEFFAARTVQGASRARFSCMQCDLCLKRLHKSRSANPYALFAESMSK